MKEKHISIILGFMCFLLTVGIFMQIKTVSQNSIKLGTNRAENELRDSVRKWKEKYDLAYDQLEKKEARLEKLREKASNTGESSESIKTELETNNIELGLTEVIGQGITITLDNPKAKYRINYIKYRIYNKDGSYTEGTKRYITRKKDE